MYDDVCEAEFNRNDRAFNWRDKIIFTEKDLYASNVNAANFLPRSHRELLSLPSHYHSRHLVSSDRIEIGSKLAENEPTCYASTKTPPRRNSLHNERFIVSDTVRSRCDEGVQTIHIEVAFFVGKHSSQAVKNPEANHVYLNASVTRWFSRITLFTKSREHSDINTYIA